MRLVGPLIGPLSDFLSGAGYVTPSWRKEWPRVRRVRKTVGVSQPACLTRPDTSEAVESSTVIEGIVFSGEGAELVAEKDVISSSRPYLGNELQFIAHKLNTKSIFSTQHIRST